MSVARSSGLTGDAQPLLHIEGRRRGALEQRGERDCRGGQVGDLVHHQDVLELGLGEDGSDFAVLGFGGHNGDAGRGIIEEDGDLLGGQGGIDGDIGGAKHQGGEVDDWPLPTILRKDGDAVALLNAPTAEGVASV